MLVGRGTRRPGREQILRRRDVPLNRQQWLFGERTSIRGRGSARRNHVPLKNNLHTGQLSPAQLLHLVDRGEYVCISGCGISSLAAKKGNFFIAGRTPGRVSLFCPLAGTPGGSETFTIECRPFVSELRTGQSFVSTCGRIQQSVKRASATISDGGETAGEGAGGRA